MKKFSLIFLCSLLIFVSSCKKSENKLSSTQVMMDTVVTVTIWDADAETLNGAMDLCRYYDQLFSRTIETSDVSRINRGGTVTVSPETAELIKLSLEIAEKSKGAFDITVLPLVELWDINNSTAPPTETRITEALDSVDYTHINVSGTTVNANGTKIDLGGIAKGYVTDKIRNYLNSKGVDRAIVNLGGNVCVLGTNGDKDYSVGIQKPFGLHGESAAILKLSNKTAVTSGIYERYFEHENIIYHHVLDPATGYPAETGILSVTVIADNSALADSLSTACLILGVDEGMKLAESFSTDTVFLLKDGGVTVSSNLKIDENGPTPTVTFKK